MNVGYCGMLLGKRYPDVLTLLISIGSAAIVGAGIVLPLAGWYGTASSGVMMRLE